MTQFRYASPFLALFGLSNCTFGTESWTDCSRSYGPSMVEASALALASSPARLKEGWAMCGDGRRVYAAIDPLRAAGFAVSGPRTHFEVPNASCIAAERDVPAATYDPLQSLEWVCRVADASRSVITGGSLAAPGQEPSYIRSAAETQADRKPAEK